MQPKVRRDSDIKRYGKVAEKRQLNEVVKDRTEAGSEE